MTTTIAAMLHARKWTHYLTRPFSIFGASLWQEWYFSSEAKKCFGATMPDALFVEQSKEVVRCYRPRKHIDDFRSAVYATVRDTRRLARLFDEADALNRRAVRLLRKKDRFSNLEEGVAFIRSIGLRATVLPFFTVEYLAQKKPHHQELLRRAERLRRVSYYPKVIEEILVPMAASRIRKHGISDAGQAVHLLTFAEIMQGKFRVLPSRLRRRNAGFLFVYQNCSGREYILWVRTVHSILAALEPELMRDSTMLRGVAAYHGKICGRARIVDARHWQHAVFHDGDILVSINANPSLLPLIKKASALVTDEGGAMSHAAIVARELKIPCVMGTKRATLVLRDGDSIEVDASHGIVRKLP